MKKVLFATTALVATASIASADVALKGSAEMGIFGGNGVTGVDPQFFTDVDVNFSGKGTTDGGVEFGFSVDLDEGGAGAAAVANNADDGGATIYVSGTFGKLTMGDTDGGFDWAMSEVAGPAGSINDDHTGHAGYNGNSGFDGTNDGQIAAYEYSFADFAFAVSAEIDDNGGTPGVVYGIGAKYSVAMSGASLSLGLGYQGYTNASIWGASAAINMDNGLYMGVNYSQTAGTAVDDTQHYGIGLGYSVDAVSVGVNYGSYNRTVGADTSGFGVAAQYDLGGGMKLHAGYGWSDRPGTANDTSSYSFGASMSF
ncbi:MAG: porin [Paracoccaceae bacterium]